MKKTIRLKKSSLAEISGEFFGVFNLLNPYSSVLVKSTHIVNFQLCCEAIQPFTIFFLKKHF